MIFKKSQQSTKKHIKFHRGQRVNLLNLNEFSGKGWVCLLYTLNGCRMEFLNYDVFSVGEDFFFTLTDSLDPDEMLRTVTFHFGLHHFAGFLYMQMVNYHLQRELIHLFLSVVHLC